MGRSNARQDESPSSTRWYLKAKKKGGTECPLSPLAILLVRERKHVWKGPGTHVPLDEEDEEKGPRHRCVAPLGEGLVGLGPVKGYRDPAAGPRRPGHGRVPKVRNGHDPQPHEGVGLIVGHGCAEGASGGAHPKAQHRKTSGQSIHDDGVLSIAELGFGLRALDLDLRARGLEGAQKLGRA